MSRETPQVARAHAACGPTRTLLVARVVAPGASSVVGQRLGMSTTQHEAMEAADTALAACSASRQRPQQTAINRPATRPPLGPLRGPTRPNRQPRPRRIPRPDKAAMMPFHGPQTNEGPPRRLGLGL